jgi:predicted dehydrogenase
VDRVNVGVIGVGGRGAVNLAGVAAVDGVNIVALCDVDEEALAKAAAKFPKAAIEHDFRKLLERKEVEAVVISTPDHTHAPAAALALRQGKHVYVEKPLTHSVYEARVLTELAAQSRCATQMGNQHHSSETYRRAVEWVQAGVIGPVRQVHAWTNRPIWPQGIDRPAETPPVPRHVHWDLWLGPAPERPYHPAYHPFRWRGWWDFGTGALGDMGCHILDPIVWALHLSAPTEVEAESSGLHPETAPKWSVIRWTFPARRLQGRPSPQDQLPPVQLTWYDGGKLPPKDLFEGVKIPGNGSLLIGDKGKLLLPHGGGPLQLLPQAQFAGFQAPAPFLPRSPGHYREWIEACKGGKPAGSHFGYAGPLTEIVLLGNVALRTGRKILWDSAALKALHCPEADRFLRREYRKGWTL